MQKNIILIATDDAKDAETLKWQLTSEYKNVFTSSRPNLMVQDFEYHQPDVLVLAFNTVEKAKHYYLQLQPLSSTMQAHPHRTLILCNQDELHHAYDLCKKNFFDDYILFWPTPTDVTRLAMAVHQAMRNITAIKTKRTALTLASQAHRLAILESLLDSSVIQCDEHIKTVSESVTHLEQEVNVSLDEFFQHLTQGDFSHLVEVKDANGLKDEADRLQQDEIHSHFQTATQSITSLQAWTHELQQKHLSNLVPPSVLRSMVEKPPATILVVDDDEMALKLVKMTLKQENYNMLFATGGIEALKLLDKQCPDLILMDMMMPDIDGLETLLQIKSGEQFTSVPVVMVTGNSDKDVVSKCLKAGAADFLVKPFSREILLDKIRKFLY